MREISYVPTTAKSSCLADKLKKQKIMSSNKIHRFSPFDSFQRLFMIFEFVAVNGLEGIKDLSALHFLGYSTFEYLWFSESFKLSSF